MFVICSHCQAKDEKCPVCQGERLALSLNGQFFFWQKNLSTHFIYSQKILKGLSKLFDFLIFLFILSSLALTGYFLFKYLSVNGQLIDFFLKKNLITSLFFVAVFFSLFIFYRLSNFKKSASKVAKKPFEAIISQDFDGQEIWQAHSNLKKINIAPAFCFQSLELINNAFLLAVKNKQPLLPVHIFFELLKRKEIRGFLFRLGVDTGNLKERLRGAFLKIEQTDSLKISIESLKLFLAAYETAYDLNKESVDIDHIFIALSQNQSLAAEIIFDLNLDKQKLINVVLWAETQRKIAGRWHKLQSRSKNKPKGAMNRAYTATVSPFTDMFAEDLTALAKNGYLEPAIGKEKELNLLFSNFAAGAKGVILIGQPGCGKSFVIDSLAQMMAAELVPALLQDKRLLRLSVPRIVAGADAPGAIEERLLGVLKEIHRAGNIILIIDNVDSLVGLATQSSKSLDLAETLAAELEKGYFLMIAIADEQKYQDHLKKSALAANLKKINVEQPSKNQVIRILQAKVPFLENKYHLFLSYQALEAAVDFSNQYITDEFQPKKAVAVLEATVDFVSHQKDGRRLIQAEDVAVIISELTKIPVTKVTALESEKLLNLEQLIHERIVGQDEAVICLATALRRSKANLRSPNRPIANFLFLGPTGVGKTEVARTLSDVYFGGQQNIIRLDMSEYVAASAIDKLIGTNGHPGYLSNQLKNKPFSLFLLDEFEKASSEIHNLFLQIMEDGRLTDGAGQTLDFSNTIIIATSNAGTHTIQQRFSQNIDHDKIKQELVSDILPQYFKPELINRFDEIVVFKPLTMSQVKKITELLLKQLIKKLADKGLSLEFSPTVSSQIARLGFNPDFGARPLKRVIADKLESQIANLILSNKIKRRDQIIVKSLTDIQIKKAVNI